MLLLLIGAVAGLLVFAIGAVSLFAAFWAASWFAWKRRQLRLRREWTQENPYWKESFDAGVAWANRTSSQTTEGSKP